MRKVDFSNLPRKPHNNTTVVDWKNVNGEFVDFVYDDIEDKMQLFYSHTSGKYAHFITCVYNGVEKRYSTTKIIQMDIRSLIDPHPKNLPPTKENWLYQRTDLHRLVSDPEDLKNYHISSGLDYNFICPNCKKVLKKQINSVVRHGLSCDLCPSSGCSKNERIMSHILTKMNMDYKTEKCFEDCRIEKMLPFDFYLPSTNTVIEMHGEQHYKDIGYYNHKNTVKSDNIKKEYCIDNDIEYIEVDCSSRNAKDIVKNIKAVMDITLTDDEIMECVWEASHDIGIDMETIKNLYESFWNVREIAGYTNSNENKIRELLKDNGMINKNNFSFWASCIDIVSGKIYGNYSELERQGIVPYMEKAKRRIKNGKPIEYKETKLCVVKRSDLLLGVDKSHLKEVYKEAMKQLNKNKENKFDKFVSQNVDDIIYQSDNQREVMLLLDNLPPEYYIENGIVYKY